MGLKRALLSSVVILAVVVIAPRQANSTYPVIDTAAIAKLTDQLTQMQKQIEELTSLNTKLQAQIDAIGRAGQITLPSFNLAKIRRRIGQDLQCLKPDLSKLMPNVTFDDADWQSVCQASAAYQDTLWVDPEKLKELPTWEERRRVVRETDQRRDRVIADTAGKGLAHADIASKGAELLNSAADDLETSANAAKTQNDRLAVLAQGQVLTARALAQQNQILAQLLKVQSAFAMKAGVSIESLPSGQPDQAGGGQ